MDTRKDLLFAVGFKGLIILYPKNNFYKSILYPSIISVLFVGYIIYTKIELIGLIDYLSNIIISVLPNILGFILTAYALIIGLTGTETIKKMSTKSVKDKEDGKPSLFQIVNATFAFLLIALVFILLFGIIINYILHIDFRINCSALFAQVINLLVCFLLTLSITYIVFATKDIIFNVFNFGQFVHSLNYSQNIKDSESKE